MSSTSTTNVSGPFVVGIVLLAFGTIFLLYCCWVCCVGRCQIHRYHQWLYFLDQTQDTRVTERRDEGSMAVLDEEELPPYIPSERRDESVQQGESPPALPAYEAGTPGEDLPPYSERRDDSGNAERDGIMAARGE